MNTEKTRALVLTTVPYSDSKAVVTLLTRERGRIAVMSAVGAGKTARMRQARLMPLSLIETDLPVRAGAGLPTLRQFSLLTVWRRLYMHPVRSALALFMAEFLGRMCQDAAPDPALWEFAVGATRILDSAPAERLANFHLSFLISLLPLAGIQPDTSSWREGRWFDMRGGVFGDFPPRHPDRLSPEESETMMAFLRMNFYNAPRYRLTRLQRRQVLETLLRYYAIHFPGTASMRCPEVLTEVFDA